ncbi:alpha/beta fold hydrolase [Nocardia sp. NPDC005366]|uniref:alpha/beta fold hydrolase n=1 Tax=Nocardia sp. NPDC005366 TaxID=3156878 RepID=UPI0033BEEEDF
MPDYDPNSIGHFRSPEGERAYKASYAKAMKLLPEPVKTYDIQTGFGTVRAYRFADDKHSVGAPIVLFPGRTSGTPMWAENLEDLAAERTVYALDALGDAGLSVQTRPIENSTDQAAWIEETLAGLGVDKAHIVGHSFGGWLAANFAVHCALPQQGCDTEPARAGLRVSRTEMGDLRQDNPGFPAVLAAELA